MTAVLHEALNHRRHRADQPLGEVAVEPTRSEPDVLDAVM
jgi:hypothetical protein